MAHERKNVVEELAVLPESENEAAFYSRNSCPNFEELTFDYSWKHYAPNRKDPLEVPELKRLYVPRCLFMTVGVSTFMEIVFPNCKVEFWEN
jgi:hypothetical protein